VLVFFVFAVSVASPASFIPCVPAAAALANCALSSYLMFTPVSVVQDVVSNPSEVITTTLYNPSGILLL